MNEARMARRGCKANADCLVRKADQVLWDHRVPWVVRAHKVPLVRRVVVVTLVRRVPLDRKGLKVPLARAPQIP